jgi:tight adherence protein B
MILLGALAAGVCLVYAVGIITGHPPNVRIRMHGAGRSEESSRQIWLKQAGLDITPRQYYVIIGFVALLTFAVVVALTGTPAVALAPAIAAVAIPHSYFAKSRRKYLGRTKKAWPDAIGELIASIESNASLHSALNYLADKGPEPLRPAFSRFPSLSSTMGTVPALEAVREQLSDPTSDRVIEVLILAHERGGSIVTDILRDLAKTTAEDLSIQEDIESAQLEQKINGRAVFVIPWAVLVLLVVANGDFRTFYQSPVGYIVVVIGAVMSFVGMAILAYMSRDQVEPRVFGGSAKSQKANLIDDDNTSFVEAGDDADEHRSSGQVLRRKPAVQPDPFAGLEPVVPTNKWADMPAGGFSADGTGHNAAGGEPRGND